MQRDLGRLLSLALGIIGALGLLAVLPGDALAFAQRKPAMAEIRIPDDFPYRNGVDGGVQNVLWRSWRCTKGLREDAGARQLPRLEHCEKTGE